jgi:hypothetical protein
MTLDERYEQFRDSYFIDAADLAAFFGIESIAKLLMSPRAPMSKKEWLEQELEGATRDENYQYCIELKTKLDGLQKDVRTDGEERAGRVT